MPEKLVEGKRNLLHSNFKIGKEKLKNYQDKYMTNHNFIKKEKNKIFEIRNTFLTSYNDNIDKEQSLLDLINSNMFDFNSLDVYVQNYKNMFNHNPGYPSNTLIKIKNALSIRKDQYISTLLETNEILSKERVVKIIEDIKQNAWKISDKNMQVLLLFMKNQNFIEQ